MAGKNVPVVLIPRFTSYVGAGFFYTLPIPVAAYDTLVLDFWHGVINGTPVVGMNLTLEESNDATQWTATSGTSITRPYPPAPGGAQFRHDLTKAWLRVGIELMGVDPAVTCSGTGFFELRER